MFMPAALSSMVLPQLKWLWSKATKGVLGALENDKI